MNQPPPEDDLKDMFVRLDPPPGGLLRHRARRDASPPRHFAWLVAGAAAAAVAIVLLSRSPSPGPAMAPSPAAPALRPASDLIAGRDLTAVHPAWIGLARLTPPAEPLLLAAELTGALASRRVPLADPHVVLYMLDPKEQVPADMPQ